MSGTLPITAVITTQDSGRSLSGTLVSLAGIVSEIIIVDSGSTDDTLQIAGTHGCKIIQKSWQGYGANKNMGIQSASQSWILAIDSDEALSEELREWLLHDFHPLDVKSIYKIKSINFLGKHAIRFGAWGLNFNYKLFPSKNIVWDHSPVHEGLVYDPGQFTEVKINAPILHHTCENIAQYKLKLDRYANATISKYQSSGKKIYVWTPQASAVFLFLKEFIFLGGFLDGKDGFDIALARSKSNLRKYKGLLNKK